MGRRRKHSKHAPRVQEKSPPVGEFARLVGRSPSPKDGARDLFDLLDVASQLGDKLRAVQVDQASAVGLAREEGATWAQVAAAVGLDAEQARYRWGRSKGLETKQRPES